MKGVVGLKEVEGVFDTNQCVRGSTVRGKRLRVRAWVDSQRETFEVPN